MPTPEAQDSPSDAFLVVTGRIRVPTSEFDFEYMRASGPGGQNVNKVSTKVRLRWNAVDSPNLPKAVKDRFLTKYQSRITTEGEILVTSQRTRDRNRNIEDALDKLRDLIKAVAAPPTPRKKTKPSRASKERRIKQKKEQAGKKQLRRKPKLDE